MVRIELLELTPDEVRYKYYPEQEIDNYGIVSVNKRTGERVILKELHSYGREYAFHACREIERYISVNNFKKRGIVAWY